jgi:hypothetical protein
MWENAAIRSLVANASEKYGVRFAEARNIHESDYSLACLDEVNARLRRHLIDLHELAEADADTQLDRAIIALYREIARRRELTLSPPQRVINLTLAPGGTDDDRIYGKRHSHGGS